MGHGQQLRRQHKVYAREPAPAAHCRLLGQVGGRAGLHRARHVEVCRREWRRMGQPGQDEAAPHHEEPRRRSHRHYRVSGEPHRAPAVLQGGELHTPLREVRHQTVCRARPVAHQLSGECAVRVLPHPHGQRLGGVPRHGSRCQGRARRECPPLCRHPGDRRIHWLGFEHCLPWHFRRQRPHAERQGPQQRASHGSLPLCRQCHHHEPAHGRHHPNQRTVHIRYRRRGEGWLDGHHRELPLVGHHQQYL